MSKVIKSLPNELDPIKMIEEKMLTCPICGSIVYNEWRFSHDDEKMDANGKHHFFRSWLNKYKWSRYRDLKCDKCGCKWDTEWYPCDYKMFEIKVDGDGDVVLDTVNKLIKDLKLDIKLLRTLTDDDLQEIQDRFGETARFVVEDMLSGEGKRWETM